MKVVYGETHQRHAPEQEFTREGFIPYFECPQRAEAILQTLRESPGFEIIAPGTYPAELLLQIHDPGYLHFLEHVYDAWVKAGEPPSGVVPVTFAQGGRCPADLVNQAGYYCFDTTPIVGGTWEAALAAARCALSGADLLLGGERAVYTLCRPPGHHAAAALCGGYCYLNNAALAAARLGGRVALLDIDYHHGNGTQEIFYTSDQVFFLSLHADPDRAYPFFWGRADECGAGKGEGCTRNLPLPAGADDRLYLEALDQALGLIRNFGPDFLVLSAGFDLLAGDPLGDFAVTLEGLQRIGERLAGLRLPALVVQEGGYNLERLGPAALNLLAPFT
jgi:acetoin utilization deacetylase AcuC-like enzyme